MSKDLSHINEKINSVQSGILRCHGRTRTALQVRVVTGDDGTLNCVVTGDIPESKLLNRKVSVIQRHKDDYLYIAGKVNFVGEHTSRVVSVTIRRAFWFIRKIKGTVTWLENKYVYENKEDRA